jgi:hypothetical protein
MMQRRLRLIGTWGAILTLAILLASALLRLATGIEAGEARSLLPPAVETGARIAHRLSAMGVAILAALAVAVTLRDRPAPASRVVAVAAIVALTLVLASIGRYTPGYRLAAVTVINVTGGTALACAFWWLREIAMTPSADSGGGPSIVPALALVLLLTQSALGAAASAAAMWGAPASAPLHAWMAVPFLIAVAAASLRARERRAVALAVVALAALQVALGIYLGSAGARPLAFTLAHAAIAFLLALPLVSMAAGPTGRLTLAQRRAPSG